MKYLVGIDNGGTFSKTALFDEKRKQLASATVPTQTLTPKPGYAQRDMNELWKVNAKSIKSRPDFRLEFRWQRACLTSMPAALHPDSAVKRSFA